MQHVWTNFDKNTHTCERSQLKSMKRKIFKLSLLTHYKFSLEKKYKNEKDCLRLFRMGNVDIFYPFGSQLIIIFSTLSSGYFHFCCNIFGQT